MLTAEQYNELLYNQDCSLTVIEHLDVYQVLHWTPDQLFARLSGNVIYHSPTNALKPYNDGTKGEQLTFIVLLARGLDKRMIHECNLEAGERVVVSFRKAIQDRIGYAFVSLQRRKIPLDVKAKP